jgi:dTDP-4-dehydrorhamnose reductase
MEDYMKIVVTGATGKLGTALVQRGCLALKSDITMQNDLTSEIHSIKPDILIHCAAITGVDYCESHYKEAFEVNVRGTLNVFDALPKTSTMIYISTDHIFPGENWFDVGYSEVHKPQPVNYYGFTKWGGELAMQKTSFNCRPIIVRTSKSYDYESMKPTIDALNKEEEIVLTDLIRRSFMYVPHFVGAILWLANNTKEFPETKETEIINIAGDCVFSYYRFWTIMKDALGLGGRLVPRRTKLRPEEASPRPFRAGLDVRYAKNMGVPIGSMQDAIKDLKEKMKNE